eukprot:10343-Heterococcus_DN1.PRE.4
MKEIGNRNSMQAFSTPAAAYSSNIWGFALCAVQAYACLQVRLRGSTEGRSTCINGDKFLLVTIIETALSNASPACALVQRTLTQA